jgi:hypothetical protein
MRSPKISPVPLVAAGAYVCELKIKTPSLHPSFSLVDLQPFCSWMTSIFPDDHDEYLPIKNFFLNPLTEYWC